MEVLTQQPLISIALAVLAGILATVAVFLLLSRAKRAELSREENLKVLCWMSHSGKLKIDEEGNKSPRLLHIANLSRFPIFDVVMEFKNEDEEDGGKIYLEALLPRQQELFPVTEWSNLGRPVFRRARMTKYSFVDYTGQRWARNLTRGKTSFRRVKPLPEKALGVEVRQVRLPAHRDPVLLYLPQEKPSAKAAKAAPTPKTSEKKKPLFGKR